MAELKTKKTGASVQEFLDAVEHPIRREDSYAILEMMREITGKAAKMWGPSIVGYGTYHYKYASGREGDWFLTGFSPRKQALTLYIMSGFSGHDGLLKKLGKHRTGKSCLYLKRLTDVDESVLEELIRASVEEMRKRYP